MYGINLNMFWFAYYGTLVAKTIDGAARNVRVIKEVSRKNGLDDI